MEIYLVETADENVLVATEDGKGKRLDNDTGIDLEGKNAAELLKEHFSELPLNDYEDIFTENEFDWNPDEFKAVTKVH